MTPFEMYLITRLDGLRLFLALVVMFGVVATVVSFGMYSDGAFDKCKLWGKRLVAVVLTASVGLIFLPSTKDIALIYAVPAIINNEDVQALPPELAKLARMKIDELLREGEKK